MNLINRESVLWSYLSEEIQGLIADGEVILDHAQEHVADISDFSYLVFPFSKAYEGFLKQLFLDLELIREDEYYGDDIRIGKLLNPKYLDHLGSLYKTMCLHKKGGPDISDKLWEVWRKGRNQVFHYFPHNFRKLSYEESLEIIKNIIDVMGKAVSQCELS